MISYQKTPILEIESQFLAEAGVRLIVKREDLNHANVSGNKWWKLKYNLAAARRLGKTTLLTLGGAYSNHIYATASAARELGFSSIGIIRGEEVRPLNQTLRFASECGMKLHFISREQYRARADRGFIKGLERQFGDFYFIPEGGTNDLAVKGCAELAKEILSETDFDFICLPVGTGGTMAGLVIGLEGRKEVLGFSALKGGTFLSDEIAAILKSHPMATVKNWRIETAYHFGGYGKSTSELEDFISIQELKNGIPLDSVYTSKMMFGVYDLIKNKGFKKGTTILLLHTGGLQGRKL